VAGRDLLKLPPQILVLDGLAVGRAPVIGFPVRQPLGNALTQIPGIGEERDFAGFSDGLKRRDGGLEFHTMLVVAGSPQSVRARVHQTEARPPSHRVLGCRRRHRRCESLPSCCR